MTQHFWCFQYHRVGQIFNTFVWFICSLFATLDFFRFEWKCFLPYLPKSGIYWPRRRLFCRSRRFSNPLSDPSVSAVLHFPLSGRRVGRSRRTRRPTWRVAECTEQRCVRRRRRWREAAGATTGRWTAATTAGEAWDRHTATTGRRHRRSASSRCRHRPGYRLKHTETTHAHLDHPSAAADSRIIRRIFVRRKSAEKKSG